MRAIIFSIVQAFYQKATNDILIGYHFNKFNEPEILNHHLERITSFWEMQLTGETSIPLEKGFQLLFTHLQLNIKRGELGRWVLLFHQTLDEFESQNPLINPNELCTAWKKRIALFEERFRTHPKMFN